MKRDQRVTMVRKVKSIFRACIFTEFSRPRSVWNQNVNSAGPCDINTTYFIWIKKEPAIIWKLVTCQRITSEKIHDLDGSTPEPAIGSGDTGQQIPCFDSCQLLTTLMCNQWAPKVVRKCESKHWYACGADGRSVGVRSRDYQIFSDGYIITFSYPRCSAGALCVRELRYN